MQADIRRLTLAQSTLQPSAPFVAVLSDVELGQSVGTLLCARSARPATCTDAPSIASFAAALASRAALASGVSLVKSSLLMRLAGRSTGRSVREGGSSKRVEGVGLLELACGRYALSPYGSSSSTPSGSWVGG